MPLLPEVRTALLDLLKDNPHSTDDSFVFYSLQPDKPCDCKVLLNGLKNAMDTVNMEFMDMAKKVKLEKPEIAIDYKGRNITFHSWRHWFCSKITEIIDGEKVAKVSGHLTEAVFENTQTTLSIRTFRKLAMRRLRLLGMSCNSGRRCNYENCFRIGIPGILLMLFIAVYSCRL